MASGVLVFGEATEDGRLAPVVAELLGAGSRLGTPVVCALLGSGVEPLAQECVARGADKVIVVDDSILLGTLGFRKQMKRYTRGYTRQLPRTTPVAAIIPKPAE